MSLIPSATEIVCALGARGALVGRSHECDFPDGLEHAEVLTSARTDPGSSSSEIDEQVRGALGSGESLYHLDIKGLRDLFPDLIITQDLCDVCSIDPGTVRAGIEGMDRPPEVVTLNPMGLEDVLDDVLRVGAAMGIGDRGRGCVSGLRHRMDRAEVYVNPYEDGPECGFMEWTDPVFVAGHWNVQIIERSGATHTLNPTEIVPGSGAAVGPQQAQRRAGASIAVDPDRFVGSDPEILVIAPCGLGLERVEREFSELMEKDWFRGLRAVENRRVALVDGNQMFNRPGPRLVDALEFMVGWINGCPDLIPEGFPWVDPFGSG